MKLLKYSLWATAYSIQRLLLIEWSRISSKRESSCLNEKLSTSKDNIDQNYVTSMLAIRRGNSWFKLKQVFYARDRIEFLDKFFSPEISVIRMWNSIGTVNRFCRKVSETVSFVSRLLYFFIPFFCEFQSSFCDLLDL